MSEVGPGPVVLGVVLGVGRPLLVTEGVGAVVPGGDAALDALPLGRDGSAGSDDVGTGRLGTSVEEGLAGPGAAVGPGECVGGVRRTVPGSSDGTPGMGSNVPGAKGAAPMKLSASAIV
ncbi:hypothetical protein [Streptomyces sp. SYP-A7185]|uniref:hypothetical protein n=1 Tax=Streptomyces sp. SYP-A7185 TaxID=3040076 RepID=UPI0038F73B15